VLELFDKESSAGKPIPFDDADRQLARGAAEFGADILRQALAERQTHRVLFDAVAAALRAGDEVTQALRPRDEPPPEAPTADVMEQLAAGLRGGAVGAIDARTTLRLAEAIRVLALRYGPGAVDHCIRLVESLRALLDETTGVGEEGRL
jgi:two-component system nitrogen regulation response regulator NtrX